MMLLDWRRKNLTSRSFMESCSSCGTSFVISSSAAFELFRRISMMGAAFSMWVSCGLACPPWMTFSGTISSSPPSIGGRLLSRRASFRVSHGPPTEACRMLARSSKLPFSFSVRSNSTYVPGSAPIIGSRKELIRCCNICRSGPRHSAYSALALSLLLAYVCVSLCHTSEGLIRYAAATASRDSFTLSTHCCSLKLALKVLISIPSSISGIDPALFPPAPHASRKALIHRSLVVSDQGCTSFGLTICAFSRPEDRHSSFRNRPACICSSSVCRNAEIGETYPPGFPGEYVQNRTNSSRGISILPPLGDTTTIFSGP